MIITKITPRGFCKGVVDAWAMAKLVVNKYPNRPKYMVGWLVHNKNIVDEIESMGINVLDDTKQSRWDLINSIDQTKNPIVIFSAHGTDPKLIEHTKNIGIEIYDSTCIYVKKVHKLINEKINNNYQIIYIGVKNHPESNSVLSLSKNIKLITSENDIDNLQLDEKNKIFVTNQTTISIYEFFNLVKKLKSKYKNIEFKNDICDAAKSRQDAIINMDKSIDLLIVVGDNRSNNTKKLLEISKNLGIDSKMVSSKNEINSLWFKNKKHVGITSGCSTPTWITNEVINWIEEYRNRNERNSN